jgi:hypothetical protein
MDDELDRLLMREEELKRELEGLRRRRTTLERAARPRRAERPLRDVALDLLAEAGAPLNSLLIASALSALYGREVPSTRFGTLSIDEQKSFAAGRVARPVYLCHCLNAADGVAVKRFWARSDWALHERIIGAMTGRVLFLKSAIWITKMAHDRGDAAPERLKFLAADHARSAGLRVDRGSFQFVEWLTALEVQLQKHLPEDEEVRRAAAATLQGRLNDRDMLFGARGGLVSIPGTTRRWKEGNE